MELEKKKGADDTYTYSTPVHSRNLRNPEDISNSLENERISGIKTVEKKTETNPKFINSTPSADLVYKSPTSLRFNADRAQERHKRANPPVCKKEVPEGEKKLCPVCMKELSGKGVYEGCKLHHFHFKCIKDFLNEEDETCPICEKFLCKAPIQQPVYSLAIGQEPNIKSGNISSLGNIFQSQCSYQSMENFWEKDFKATNQLNPLDFFQETRKFSEPERPNNFFQSMNNEILARKPFKDITVQSAHEGKNYSIANCEVTNSESSGEFELSGVLPFNNDFGQGNKDLQINQNWAMNSKNYEVSWGINLNKIFEKKGNMANDPLLDMKSPDLSGFSNDLSQSSLFIYQSSESSSYNFSFSRELIMALGNPSNQLNSSNLSLFSQGSDKENSPPFIVAKAPGIMDVNEQGDRETPIFTISAENGISCVNPSLNEVEFPIQLSISDGEEDVAFRNKIPIDHVIILYGKSRERFQTLSTPINFVLRKMKKADRLLVAQMGSCSSPNGISILYELGPFDTLLSDYLLTCLSQEDIEGEVNLYDTLQAILKHIEDDKSSCFSRVISLCILSDNLKGVESNSNLKDLEKGFNKLKETRCLNLEIFLWKETAFMEAGKKLSRSMGGGFHLIKSKSALEKKFSVFFEKSSKISLFDVVVAIKAIPGNAKGTLISCVNLDIYARQSEDSASDFYLNIGNVEANEKKTIILMAKLISNQREDSASGLLELFSFQIFARKIYQDVWKTSQESLNMEGVREVFRPKKVFSSIKKQNILKAPKENKTKLHHLVFFNYALALYQEIYYDQINQTMLGNKLKAISDDCQKIWKPQEERILRSLEKLYRIWTSLEPQKKSYLSSRNFNSISGLLNYKTKI